MNFIIGPKCYETTANCAESIIRFTIGNLQLQEPMALLTNWMIAFTCLILYKKIKNPQTLFELNWKRFYAFFGVSVFFGGLGHLFFHYLGVYGKFPCWILGVFASYFAGKAMISTAIFSLKNRNTLHYFLVAKCSILGVLAILYTNFIFITIDAVLSYLFYCGIVSLIYWRKGRSEFKYIVYAILVLLPSIFIFLLRLNPHVWFNKEDLSHILMILTIILFYFGVQQFIQLNKKTSLSV
jgi:cbb3-type cytochrome oxidase subunit 3